MKSINNIFKDNKDLMYNKSVKELIDYCHDLEDEIIDYEQDKKDSFEIKLKILVNEIYQGIKDTLKEDEDRSSDEVNFKESLINLKKYLDNFSRKNGFYFD